MSDTLLVDTNVFLRLTSPNHPHHATASQAIRRLLSRGERLCYTLQTASEFWNACTRPAAANGLGYSPEEADGHLRRIESSATLLPDNAEVYASWRRLLRHYGIHGTQVHDAKLTAAVIAHSVGYLLTFNAADFKRYGEIRVVDPANV